MNLSAPRDAFAPPTHRPHVWERWAWVWNIGFFLAHATATALAIFEPTPRAPRIVIVPIATVLAAWYAATVVRETKGTRTVLSAAVTVALWVVLVLLHPAYLIVTITVLRLFAILPARWVFAGATAVMALATWWHSMNVASLQLSDRLHRFHPLVTAIPGAFLMVLTLYVGALIRQSSERQRLIDALARAREDLAAAERSAGALAERHRLAREIHDTLAQDLASIVLHVEAVDLLLPSESAARPLVARARETARSGLTEARRMVWALRPSALDGTTLFSALERLVSSFQDETKTIALAVHTGEPIALHPDLEVALFRVAQESLTNIRRHAGAQRVDVTLSFMRDTVALDVRDDGRGFDPSLPRLPDAIHGAGFGIDTMRERIRQVGGELVIESSAGTGTTVAVTVPVSVGDKPDEARKS